MATAKRSKGRVKVLLYDKGCKYQTKYHGIGAKFTASRMTKEERAGCDTFDGTGLKLADAEPEWIDACPVITYWPLPSLTGSGEECGGFLTTPYLDASQAITKAHFATTGGTWEDIDDPDIDGTVVFQRDGTENTVATATSVFRLPVEPWIDLSLWRGEPTKEQDRLTYPAYTRIEFGKASGELALVIPYGGQEPWVEWYSVGQAAWLKLKPISGGLSAVEGIAKGQRLRITICSFNGVLCIRFGRGMGSHNSVYWRLPTVDYTYVADRQAWEPAVVDPVIHAGPVRIEHNAGQIMFRWWPIYCRPGTSTLRYQGTIDAGYAIWEHKSAATPQLTAADCECYRQLVWRELPYGPLTPVTSSEVTVTPYNPASDGFVHVHDGTEVGWCATWAPVKWDLQLDGSLPKDITFGGVASGITYYQSPMLFAAQILADPVVIEYATGWPDATDITALVQSLHIDGPDGAKPATLTLQAYNGAGSFAGIANNQMVTVDLGYQWDDGTDDLDAWRTVFVGYVVTPGQNATPGPRIRADLIAYDPLCRLKDEKAYGLEPDFQRFTATNAVQWLARRAGFGEVQMSLTGSTTPMYLGRTGYDGVATNGVCDPTNDALLPGWGTELLASVEEFCKRDGESAFWVRPDETDAFVLVKTNGAYGDTDGVLFEIKEDAADAVDPTNPAYHLRSLQVDAVGMDPGQYADCVAARGKTPDGRMVQVGLSDTARLYDPTNAAYGGGWRHIQCVARDHIQSDADLRTYANKTLTERKRLPIIARVTTDLTWLPSAGRTIQKGDRFKITEAAGTGVAATLGVRSTTPAPKIFRVIAVQHAWDSANEWPVTIITGRSLWTT